MSKDLEQFMRDNRDQFDDSEPREQVWTKLEEALKGEQQLLQQPVTAKVRKISLYSILRYPAVAAILLLAGYGVFSLLNKRTGNDPNMAQHPSATDTPATSDQLLKEINPNYAQEVVQFTRLIELKQNELKEIEKDAPTLYRRFVADINKLDSSYKALKKELPENSNREQLLEAMIENLRLQTEILNQQLSIINQIKASKTNSHEG